MKLRPPTTVDEIRQLEDTLSRLAKAMFAAKPEVRLKRVERGDG